MAKNKNGKPKGSSTAKAHKQKNNPTKLSDDGEPDDWYNDNKGKSIINDWWSEILTLSAVGGILLALGYTYLIAPVALSSSPSSPNNKNISISTVLPDYPEAKPSKVATLSQTELLTMVRKSNDFNLTSDKDSNNNRTLTATTSIIPGTILMEIPRGLMIWDLDAVRNRFIQTEFLSRPPFFVSTTGEKEEGSSKGKKKSMITDTLSRRAMLLSAYLALLRNGVVNPSKEFPLQTSAARAMPSYEEFAAFHPVLADVDQMKTYLGGEESSLSFLHLVHIRTSLSNEYNLLSTTSQTFASLVSRQEYMASRLAVQSRAFQISNIPISEISEKERRAFTNTIGIDFTSAVVSIEPVNDWMNNHVNNNVKVGGYNAKQRSGLAEAIKPIAKGRELINSYGKFYDHVLFSQYGFVPTDGTGTSVASLFVHHDMDLMGDLSEGAAHPTLPSLEKMVPYLQLDYGYAQCITEESQPSAFEFKRLKLQYLQQISIDSSRWVLPLPPRSKTTDTPASTSKLPEDYKVPGFTDDVFEHFQESALTLSLPCRLITMTDRDLDNDGAAALLRDDLETLQKETNHNVNITPILKLEELEVSIDWMIRTVHCMKGLAQEQVKKYHPWSVAKQEEYVMSLVESGSVINSLEWNAAHVKLMEMQSQEALAIWAQYFFDSIVEMGASQRFRVKPCPVQHMSALIP